VATCDNDYVFDAGVDQGLNWVINHGSIVHGQEVLIRNAREWVKPGTFSTGQNYTFHCSLLTDDNQR
jgi:hypothetical protein